jgi:SAM-dependent methyltransferase
MKSGGWLARFIAVMCGAAVATAPAIAQSPMSHQHSFDNAEKWAHIFDDPKRDAWQKPHEVIEALALKSDAVVADIGAGTGYFAARLANMLPRGQIYAIDIEPDMVKYLAERARRENLPNVKAITASADDPHLPTSVDVMLLVDVYHHIDNRENYFSRLRSSLNPGGRLVIIDFTLDSPDGPPKQMRIAPKTVKDELSKAGYVLRKEHAFLPRQYFLEFSPRP